MFLCRFLGLSWGVLWCCSYTKQWVGFLEIFKKCLGFLFLSISESVLDLDGLLLLIRCVGFSPGFSCWISFGFHLMWSFLYFVYERCTWFNISTFLLPISLPVLHSQPLPSRILFVFSLLQKRWRNRFIHLSLVRLIVSYI